MKHTPGPWWKNNGGYFIETAVEQDTIAQLYALNGGDEEVLANATLIHAAPEMLEALKATLAYLPDAPNMTTLQVWAAIDRATKAGAPQDG